MAMMNMGWMKGSGTDVANYFMGGNAVDYYLDENDPSYWLGKDAHRAGFSGLVEKKDLKAALSNRDAYGGKLTHRDVKGRRAGLEIVVSEPKTVSMMYALAGDTRIMDAHKTSMNMLFDEMQRLGAYRRLRVDKQDASIYTGSLMGSMFTHTLGRPTKGTNKNQASVPDFQLHTHMLLANATYDADKGRWYALDGDFLLKHSDYFRAFYNATMANQLHMLGYQLELKNGNYEIAGLDDIPKKFSNRRAEINEYAEERNITDRSKLGVMTRERKSDKLSWEDLQSIWASRLTPSESAQIRDTFLKSLGMGAIKVRDQSPEFTDKVMNRMAADKTWVKERKLIAAVLREGIGKVDHDTIREHIDRMVEAKQWMRHKRYKDKLTTKAAKLKAIEVIDMWKVGIGKHEKLGRDNYTVKAPDKPHLEALNKLYSSRDRVTSMRGNVYRKEAIAKAKADLNAGEPFSEHEIWFVEEDKIRDDQMPDVLRESGEKRIVIWGGKERSHYEEDMNLEPLRLYDKAKPTKRAKDLRRHAIDRASQSQREQSVQHRPERERSTG